MKTVPAARALAWLLAAATFSAHRVLAADPDFGPNVIILEPGADVQAKLDGVHKRQEAAQFGSGRYAILLKPGTYDASVMVGFYTHVAGLGKSPDDVQITGYLGATARWMNYNATCNFWRTVENVSVKSRKTPCWSVSQGTAFRRVHVHGDFSLAEGGWSSGGFLGDCVVDGTINSNSQQQYLTRNTEMKGWRSGVWNMVFVGTTNPPGGDWPGRPYTVAEKTPIIREKPFLYLDGDNYAVMVPPLEKDVSGASWGKRSAQGRSIGIDKFFIAKDTDKVADINAALAAGKSVILTPGHYRIDDPIEIVNANTVVLGLGYPTLEATNGNMEMTVADVDGVKISGILFEAREKESPVPFQVGEKGSTADHSANPTFIYDIWARSGGAAAGSCGSFVEINSNNVVGDNSWYWRADHGAGVGWDANKTKSGIVVNGKEVTYYGLFVEHCQEYQTLWNGDGGRVYMYQSEIPYDVPNAEQWSPKGAIGYASYKVADGVTRHEAYGIGIYSLFNKAPVAMSNAMETPVAPGVIVKHVVAIRLGGRPGSGFTHVINGTGASAISKMKSTAN